MKLSSLISCIVGCRIPSGEIFAEKYETKIMRMEIFMDPTVASKKFWSSMSFQNFSMPDYAHVNKMSKN
jgi:hypothetical protein